jgi:hypothetical protein
VVFITYHARFLWLFVDLPLRQQVRAVIYSLSFPAHIPEIHDLCCPAAKARDLPRLSRVQQAALGQLRHLASRALLPEQLGTRLLEAVRQAIPSDIQMLLGVDPASRLFNRLLALDERHASGFWHWLEQIYLAREPNWGTTFPGMMQAGLSAVVLHDQIESSWGMPPDLFHPLSAREFARCYHDIGSPVGGCCAPSLRWMGTPLRC